MTARRTLGGWWLLLACAVTATACVDAAFDSYCSRVSCDGGGPAGEDGGTAADGGTGTDGGIDADGGTDAGTVVEFVDGGCATNCADVTAARFTLPAHSCLIGSGGKIWCFGAGGNGQLGIDAGPSGYSAVPLAVVGLDAGMVQVTAGAGFTCARTSSGQVKCWGKNDWGQLGRDAGGDEILPRDVPGLASAVDLQAGANYACALMAGGAIRCWGYNSAYGSLGRGVKVEGSFAMPADVLLDAGATSIAVGSEHACAVLEGGKAVCWGHNWNGKLGDGTNDSASAPVAVRGLSEARAIATGDQFTCALLVGGTVACWGYNVDGQLGNGTTETSWDAGFVMGGAVSLSAGTSHACAVTVSGGAVCWGSNGIGQRGVGFYGDAGLTTTTVYGLASGVANIAAGGCHTCARLTDAGVMCWGCNSYGQLGNNSISSEYFPVPVSH